MSGLHPIFLVSYSRLTWCVTLDGAFFGAYRSKQNAIKGVNEARQTPGLRSAALVMGAVEGNERPKMINAREAVARAQNLAGRREQADRHRFSTNLQDLD